MIGQAIKLIEKGLVPDNLVRAGIRKLCQQRLEEESAYDCEKQSMQFHDFWQELKQSHIAIKTKEANEQHYELPTDFFYYALGKRFKYSSAYFDETTKNLDEAEEIMLEMYCQRGQFIDGQSILELGCGWGSLTLYLAEKFPNSQITAISNSNSQREHITAIAKERGLNNLEIITKDINEFEPGKTFDRIVSIEMFEHIRNYQQLFDKISSWLNDEGKLFVHIFCHRYLMYPYTEDGDDNWMGRFFFSGGQMPAADTFLLFQQNLSLDQRWLVNGQHYEKTSNAWLENMDKNKKHIMPIFEKTYGKDFASVWFQRWRIFFMACAELFGYAKGNEWMVSHYLFSKK
ncbi:cyclopropane-fatty-acyl-phospholipid synthase family protein [Kangiella sp. HZ709]|uniref:SAM-dependent methyltransferase n=1 Tax=Kangiella sp. HZ709 TaxID=2666328 RepID=UPI0012B05337|nr:cyclopropane-fatty-acyl-phospholipid synthase family protein [Kangiella sp. HZ709]MRX27784.1 methyltransferase domain-containing protein [Kangiella sp. HZ709]